MMKTPEEINAINRETFKARAERLCRLLDSHPATWTAEDARFYADYREAMEETAEQAQQRAHDAAEWVAFQNELPDKHLSAFHSFNRQSQDRPDEALTALIKSAVQEDSKISAKALWAWLAKQGGVTKGDALSDGKSDRLLLAGDEITMESLKDRLSRAKKKSRQR
ncbi:MAG: hypothetical protein ACK443_00845 [Methylococcaceae bacterium]|jgi:hypothetical protein